MLVGCVSFDCHPRLPFFLTSETHVVISSVSYPFDTTRSLSTEASPLLFRQQHSLSLSLSLSLLRRSLARSVCSNVPAGLSRSPPSAACALRIALNFSPRKVGAAARQPAACARRRKGPERTSTMPSSALSPRSRRHLHPPPWPCSPRRMSSSRWKII
jgi:hypothetical protein